MRGVGDEGPLIGKMRSELDLLRRHVRLLRAVEEHQPIGIIRLAELLGYPQHKVRYTLRVLEQAGLIEPSQEGAVVTDRVPRFRDRLRELLEDMVRTVEELQGSLGG